MVKQTDEEIPWAGLIAALIAAVCCLAPILLLVLGGAGAEALTGSLGYALVLAAGVLVAIVAYALWHRRRR